MREPDWEAIRRSIQLPCILKPYNGFAWENVYVVASYRELENLYNSLKQDHIMLVQEKIEYTDYFRVFCVNRKDVLITKWAPIPGGIGGYSVPDSKQLEVFGKRITDATTALNKMLDFDFNAAEWCIDEDGELWMIEAMNEVPDADRRFIPDEQYWWLVDKLCQCIMEKTSSNERNRTAFGTVQ